MRGSDSSTSGGNDDDGKRAEEDDEDDGGNGKSSDELATRRNRIDYPDDDYAIDNIPYNRLQIYNFIKENPGTHLRKINKDLGIAMGDTQYHLAILEKSGRIKSRRIGMYRHYYSADILGDKEETLLAFLRQETPRDIIIYLLEHPGSTQSDIANFKHFTAPTINWHMSKLVDAGIVLREKEGKYVKYTLQGDLKGLAYFLKIYHTDIWNKLAGRLAELFLELSTIRGANKGIVDYNDSNIAYGNDKQEQERDRWRREKG